MASLVAWSPILSRTLAMFACSIAVKRSTARRFSTEGICRLAATCRSNNNRRASICLSLSSISLRRSTSSPSTTANASPTKLEIRMYIRFIETCSLSSDGFNIETIRISLSSSCSISIPRVSRRKSLTFALVFLEISPSHDTLITSAPERYAPIIRSIKPVS